MTYGASTFSEYIDFRPIVPLPTPISDNGLGHVSSFFGSAADPYQSLVKAVDHFAGRIPDEMIPIADDSGNKICLAIRGDNAGCVYYWERSDEPPDDEEYLQDHEALRPEYVKYNNVYRIADSFIDFILRLEKSV